MVKAVTAAIQKVQLGTDKTAAELAIARLTVELSSINSAIQAIQNDKPEFHPGCLGSVTGILCSYLVLSLLPSYLREFGIVTAVAMGITVFRMANKPGQRSRREQIDHLYVQAKQVHQKLVDQRKIAES